MTSPSRNMIITGSSRGIGRAIALKVANEGDHVLVNYLQNKEAADETVRLLQERGVRTTTIQANVRDEGALKEIAAVFDRVDVLVHNAAIGVMKDFQKIRTKQWDLTIESSLRPFWLLTKLSPLVSGSSVIGISSMGSQRYIEGYAAMGAAKAGIEALTRQLAVELGEENIRVNTICGGLIKTDTLQYLKNAEMMIDIAEKLTPLGRIGQPQDIANAVWLLCQPESYWINGQVLIVDGGLSLR
jgi:enoyl-[acyl-carrier protein] reductase III